MGDEDDHPVERLTAVGVLGAGLVALFLNVEWFWLVWVLGFAVVLPAVSIVVDAYLDADGDADEEAGDDPLEALRERYANGELTEAEFERKLERLLETEDRETARELDVGGGDQSGGRRERDPEFET